MKTIIEMNNICKSYQVGEEELKVLKNVSITVNEGEFVAILGPSGSGKSTLMNIIGCMDVMNSGEYFLEGTVVHKAKESQLGKIRNKQIGFIFQRYQLIKRYTVLQNVMLPLLARGQSRFQAKKACIEKIKSVGLDERIYHKPSELSGGQQQRVAIARAIVSEPSILLADEPTGALDSNTGKEVLEIFKSLSNQGNTIIMITHDLKVAEHAHRIIRIVDGCVATE
ncbi:MAG: hypothetical protein ATN34_05195 [Epulopiscium sp. Nele67-Bin002]|nr:MAG: macrolide ABC transporter ATP-binding protein [Epulopiscium sp. Nuni2H_MBin001]OON91220.1 MAG: hypothetical protein ATN34_05195 [Epulopiscium sp. Nele67-Bin002]